MGVEPLQYTVQDLDDNCRLIKGLLLYLYLVHSIIQQT